MLIRQGGMLVPGSWNAPYVGKYESARVRFVATKLQDPEPLHSMSGEAPWYPM